MQWINCLKRENLELMNLFGQSPYSYSQSVSAFPSLNDDFSDPDNLCGKLANSSILRTMDEFGNLIHRLQAELLACYTLLSISTTDTIDVTLTDEPTTESTEISEVTKIPKIPWAVIVIITNYLPFPQAQPPPPATQILRTDRRRCRLAR